MATALILSLCACGGETQPTADSDTSPEGSPTAGTEASSDPSVSQTGGKIVITDQLGKTIEFDEPPQRRATTIMPFPYLFHAVMGDKDDMIGCNP